MEAGIVTAAENHREDERLLVQGCRDGDERAWLALHDAHAADIGRFLNGMLGTSKDTEDLVQQVFLQFLSSLKRYRGEAGLRTWLHRIARHVALHHIRGQQRRRKHVQRYAQTVTNELPNPELRMVARERLQRVQRLLAELDAPFREAWLLRELQGFSVAEAAVVLELPEATLRTRHYRARRRLFELLAAADERESGRLSNAGSRLKLVTPNEGER